MAVVAAVYQLDETKSESRSANWSPLLGGFVEENTEGDHGEKEEVLSLVPEVEREELQGVALVVGSAGGVGFVVVEVDELEVDEGVVDVVVEDDVYFIADPVLPSERGRVEHTLDAGMQAICEPCAGWRRAAEDVVGPRMGA